MSTVYNSQAGSLILLALPGTTEQDLSITIEEGILHVSITTKEEEHQYLLKERSDPKEYRFELKSNVNTDLIDAKLKHGLLTIHLPSNQSRKKIQVFAA